MSANMRIIFECVSCGKVSEGKFLGAFRELPDRKIEIEMEFDTAVVPGTEYELRLVGIYPGYASNVPCSGDILSFNADGGPIKATNYIEYLRNKEKV